MLCCQNLLENLSDRQRGHASQYSSYCSPGCLATCSIRLLTACVNMNRGIFFFICLYESCSCTAEQTVQRVQSRATGSYERAYLDEKGCLQHFKATTWGYELCYETVTRLLAFQMFENQSDNTKGSLTHQTETIESVDFWTWRENSANSVCKPRLVHEF